jgi:membrane protein
MNPKILARLLEIAFVKKLHNLSNKISLPGFQGLSIKEVTVFFYHTISKGAVTSRASAVAYSFFIALFPAIIFFFTIIPYLPIADFQHTLMELLRGLMPENAYLTVESTVFDIITRKNGGLLSFGFLTALYFSTSGINSLILAFNMSIHTTERRKVIKQRLISLFLVIILALLTIFAIALLTVGTFILNYLESIGILNDWLIIYALLAAKWIVLVGLFFFGISFVFYLGPAKKTTYRFISAGSTLATFLSVISSVGFDFYVRNFSKYNALYGSIGTILILLIWTYIFSLVLIIGFELDTSIHYAKKST